MCLVAVDVTTTLTSAEYLQLKNAGLGEKKIILNVEDGALDVDLKLKEVFPKLELAGGYCLMRTFERARTLTQMNGPYSCERIREAMGQGKIIIRPLQCDLSMEQVTQANYSEVKMDNYAKKLFVCFISIFKKSIFGLTDFTFELLME